MAKGRLGAFGGCLALTAGAAVELAGQRPSPLLGVADFAAGAALAVSGVWLTRVGRSGGWLALLAAAAWFAGTAAAGAEYLPAYAADVAALTYRGFLTNLLLRSVTSRHPIRGGVVLAVVGYAAVVAPPPVGDALTASVMGAAAVLSTSTSRRVPRESRQFLFAAVPSMAALAVTWALTAAGVAHGSGAAFVNDLLVLNAAGVLVAGSSPEDWVRGAINGLVVELGPSREGNAPVSVLLARAMSDPDLEVRYFLAGLGWFDDSGAAAEPPEAGPHEPSRSMTTVTTRSGGQVALIHGPGAVTRLEVDEAAAAAAALWLDNALVTAEMRHRAGDVRRSLRRLLVVADTERHVLQAQLRAGPVGRLQRVEATLEELDHSPSRLLRDQLAMAVSDLHRLAQGLYPADLDDRPFGEVLLDLVASAAVPVRLVSSGVEDLPTELRAVTYFVVAEGLTNVGRHSRATAGTVEVRRVGSRLFLSVLDNGRGGATLTGSRGLGNLTDRVEAAGGRLSVDSPLGGPTCVRAEIPLR